MKLVALTILTALAIALTGCAANPTAEPCSEIVPIIEEFGYAIGVAADTDDKASGERTLQEHTIIASDKLNVVAEKNAGTELGSATQALSDAIGALGPRAPHGDKMEFDMAVRDIDSLCE